MEPFPGTRRRQWAVGRQEEREHHRLSKLEERLEVRGPSCSSSQPETLTFGAQICYLDPRCRFLSFSLARLLPFVRGLAGCECASALPSGRPSRCDIRCVRPRGCVLARHRFGWWENEKGEGESTRMVAMIPRQPPKLRYR